MIWENWLVLILLISVLFILILVNGKVFNCCMLVKLVLKLLREILNFCIFNLFSDFNCVVVCKVYCLVIFKIILFGVRLFKCNISVNLFG